MKSNNFLTTGLVICVISSSFMPPAAASAQRAVRSSRSAKDDVEQRESASQVQQGGVDIRLVAQLGHSDIQSLGMSADGKFIVTSGQDDTARLWETEAGRLLRAFRGHVQNVRSVAISGNAKYVVTGSDDQTARLWEAETGKELRRFTGHAMAVNSVAITADGKYVVTGSAYEICVKPGHRKSAPISSCPGSSRQIVPAAWLWEAESGREVRRFTVNTRSYPCVAISPDGKYLVTGSSDLDDTWVQLWDAESGKELRRFMHHRVNSVAISADGKYVVSGSYDRTARLWDADSGAEVKRFIGHSESVNSVAISPDGKLVVTGSSDNTARVWQVSTGVGARRFIGHTSGVNAVAISADGKYVATGSWDKTARLWGVDSGGEGGELRRIEGHTGAITSVKTSADGKYAVTGSSDKTARLWEATTGKMVTSFIGHSETVNSVAISPDGKYVVTGSEDQTARIWDAQSGKELTVFTQPDTSSVLSVAISADGKYVLTGNQGDTETRLWEVKSGRNIRQFNWGHTMCRTLGCLYIASIAMSADGRYVVTGNGDSTVRLWKTASSKELRQFALPPGDWGHSVAISSDGKYVVGVSSGNSAWMWETASGRLLHRFEAPAPARVLGYSAADLSVDISADGKYLVIGSPGRRARILEVETGRELKQFGRGAVDSAQQTTRFDGKAVVTTIGDSTTRIWDPSTGEELCQLMSFNDGNWAVVAPDGRFDVSNLEDVKGLHWITADDPMKALTLEVFMRDYYEPKLLPRILKQEEFKPARKLSELNRVQPEVKIATIERQTDQRDLVTVTVEVAKAEREFKSGNKTVTRESDVYDLRLFRNGQVVGQAPAESDSPARAASHVTVSDVQQLDEWRKLHHVDLNPDGKRAVKFENIRLPRTADVKQVEFSAYGFNEDRIKTPTDRKPFDLPADLTPKRGRAYLITVGVNAYDDPAFDLKYSANDARSVQQTLFDRLSKRSEYEKIVQVPLISDSKQVGNERVVTENLATKVLFKAVIDSLAGRPVDPATKRQIPNADELRLATPEDLVLISFSSHGYADSDGDFYFVLADTGKGNGELLNEALLQKMRTRFLSSEQLSLWLRDVDAGEMLMIVDACHSAAAVQGKEFKPGPMGSRGLGQLSYDKGMRILTATQAEDFALGIGALKQGLLTYSLVKDGIEAGNADFRPVDTTISVSEWLQYGEHRVPTLYVEIMNGDLPSEIKNLVQSHAREIRTQQPSLFDFSRKRRNILLVGH